MSEICEQNESFEDLVKLLKPLSVDIQRISAEEFVKLNVVSDPNRIKDEVIPNACVNVIEEEEPEVEVEIDLTEVEAKEPKVEAIGDPLKTYSCFWCKNQMIGYKEAFLHFQMHIDYYPIQCSVCDEANTDVNAFVKHCRKIHPELEKAKYILKVDSVSYEWIHEFLIFDPISYPPQKYCPLCNWVELNEPDINNGTESSQSVKTLNLLHHIHEHLRYKPFNCIKCQEKGIVYRIHVLDYKSRKHIYDEHRELANDPPFHRFFNKKYTISSIDKFVTNYLMIFGLKIPKNRNTKRKAKTNKLIVETIATNGANNSKVTQNNTTVQAIAPKVVVIKQQALTLQSLMTPQPVQQMMIGNQLISFRQPLDQIEEPLLLYPSNNMINLKPIPVEATDISVVCVDPKMVEIDDKFFKYICIFCTKEETFNSKTDACLHYAIHFDYNPVVCMLCEKKFLDLSVLVHHYNSEHPTHKNNLFHYLREDQKIEKWINGFIDYQKTHEFKAHVSALYGDYCFVCHKLFRYEYGLKLNAENINTIRDHIHQHLHYFPYKCSVCFHGGRDVCFTSLHSSAVSEHLLKFHGLNITQDKHKMETEFCKLFVKLDEILDLEKFIDNRMIGNKSKLSESPLVLNLKRKLEEIEITNKKRLESLQHSTPSALQCLPSASVIPMVRKADTITYSRVPLPMTVTLSSLLAQNFPPIDSHKRTNGMSSIQFIPKASPVVQPPVRNVNPIEVIPNRISYIEPFLMCFHCHQRVSNTSELQIHHNSKHPKLTIASYAPTKRDLITLS